MPSGAGLRPEAPRPALPRICSAHTRPVITASPMGCRCSGPSTGKRPRPGRVASDGDLPTRPAHARAGGLPGNRPRRNMRCLRALDDAEERAEAARDPTSRAAAPFGGPGDAYEGLDPPPAERAAHGSAAAARRPATTSPRMGPERLRQHYGGDVAACATVWLASRTRPRPAMPGPPVVHAPRGDMSGTLAGCFR
uniref:Uncharacterized protein n=1 Tax=Alexandrium monilatum TaxID=311494 RepID=A0A7S4ULP7_9DINO